MGRILAFLKKELLEVLPPTLFFLVVFHIVLWVRRVIAPEGAFYVTSSATAIVAALVVGKAVLIIEATPFARLFAERRRITNVAWRTFLYLLIALAFQLLEEGVPLVSAHGLGEGLARFGEETNWARFWASHLALAVFIGFYTMLTALIEELGRDRFLEVFFGRRPDGEDVGAAG